MVVLTTRKTDSQWTGAKYHFPVFQRMVLGFKKCHRISMRRATNTCQNEPEDKRPAVQHFHHNICRKAAEGEQIGLLDQWTPRQVANMDQTLLPFSFCDGEAYTDTGQRSVWVWGGGSGLDGHKNFGPVKKLVRAVHFLQNIGLSLENWSSLNPKTWTLNPKTLTLNPKTHTLGPIFFENFGVGEQLSWGTNFPVTGQTPTHCSAETLCWWRATCEAITHFSWQRQTNLLLSNWSTTVQHKWSISTIVHTLV